MKNIKLILTLALLFTIVSANATLTISRNNAGPNGYWRVDQTSSGGNTRLDCNNPGTCTCKLDGNIVTFTPNPDFIDMDLEVNAIIESNLQQQILIGSFFLRPGVTVSWQGSNWQNCTISINGDFKLEP